MKKNFFYVIIATVFLVGCNSETVNGSLVGSDMGPASAEVIAVEHSIATLENLEKLEHLEKSVAISSVKMDMSADFSN